MDLIRLSTNMNSLIGKEETMLGKIENRERYFDSHPRILPNMANLEQ